MIILQIDKETRMPQLESRLRDDGSVEIRGASGVLRVREEQHTIAMLTRIALSFALTGRSH
jgi:hypothetical protein